jgi:hypothetical protein
MTDSPRSADPQRPVLNATRARQGRYGRHMVWVLVFSTLLAGIGLLLAWTWKAPSFAHANSNKSPSKAAAVFHAPEPAPIVPQPGQDHTAP